MSSSTEIASFGIWLMVGGGVMAIFGFVAEMIARTANDRGGMSKVVCIVGTAIFLLGAFFDYRWGTYW